MIGRIHVSWSVTNGMVYFRELAVDVVSDKILEYSGVPTTVIATVRHEGLLRVGYRLFDRVSITNVLVLQLPSQLVCKGSLSAMSCGNLYLF